MNLKEYTRSIAKRVRKELDCKVYHSGTRLFIEPYHQLGKKPSYGELAHIKEYVDTNKDILKYIKTTEWGVYAELINYEKYEAETIKENSTQYDKEIEELETKIKELKRLQLREKETNKKKEKIAALKKQLKELEEE